jgi:hypothetical protein
MNNFCYQNIFKIHNFQKHFWTKCVQIHYKKLINSSFFSFLIINVQIFSNFQKEWCIFDIKKWRLKKKTRIIHSRGLGALKMIYLFICAKLWKCKFCK